MNILCPLCVTICPCDSVPDYCVNCNGGAAKILLEVLQSWKSTNDWKFTETDAFLCKRLDPDGCLNPYLAILCEYNASRLIMTSRGESTINKAIECGMGFYMENNHYCFKEVNTDDYANEFLLSTVK